MLHTMIGSFEKLREALLKIGVPEDSVNIGIKFLLQSDKTDYSVLDSITPVRKENQHAGTDHPYPAGAGDCGA